MTRLIGEAPFTDGERALLIAEARKLLGMPWRHQGRRERAADCIGFGALVVGKVRPIPPPRTDYGRTPYLGKLSEGMTEYLGPPVQGEPRPADLVTLAWGPNGQDRHLALVVDHPEYGIGLLHADNNAAGAKGPRVVEHGIDAHWRKRITGCWRP
jgi:hypothetical protein